MRRTLALTVVTLALLAGTLLPAFAHTLRPAVATVSVSDSGAVAISLRVNAEALLAAIGPEHSDSSASPNAERYEQLRVLPAEVLAEHFAVFLPELLRHELLNVDGGPLPLEYSGMDIPPVGDPNLIRDSTIRLAAMLPAGAQALRWQWPSDYGSSVVRFAKAGSSEEPQSQWLQNGQGSDVFFVGAAVTSTDPRQTVFAYLRIGFEHIVPLGLDHILFVIGIFLLSTQLKPLLLQVTAFTVAHTITLGLSIYGYVSLPATIVEPLIALSIAYVGIENCLSAKLKPWRLALVFGFGLLHGMGFAGVLSEIGLPRSEFLTALISFNVGVEFGQLAVIAACWLLLRLWWLRLGWESGLGLGSSSRYRQFIVIPLSLIISCVGLYWTWERIFA